MGPLERTCVLPWVWDGNVPRFEGMDNGMLPDAVQCPTSIWSVFTVSAKFSVALAGQEGL